VHLYRNILNAALLTGAMCFPPSPTGAEPAETVPVEGDRFRSRLVAVDASWQLTLETDGARRTMPAAELVRWGACRSTPEGPLVVLGDGSVLSAEVLRFDKKTVVAEATLLGPLTLAAERVAGAVFFSPHDQRRRDALVDRLLDTAGDADRALLANGDVLEGTLSEVTEEAILVQTEVGAVRLERNRLLGIVFNPSLRRIARPEGLHAWVGLGDGSRLLVTRMALGAKTLQVTMDGGAEGKTEAEELVFLQPLGGRVTYLSDLEAAGYRQIPYLDLGWPYRKDRNVTGGMLRAEGRLYLKGLGVHSAARLSYALDGAYRRFEAELALDDAGAGGGSVRFRVYVDGRRRHASPTIRPGHAPKSISVDLSGAKRLDLLVDYADRAAVLDRADWLEARLVR